LNGKQPEERQVLNLAAQTSPQVPGPPGQVLLQRFSHVLQNAREPAADVGPTDAPIADRIVSAAESAIPMDRILNIRW